MTRQRRTRAEWTKMIARYRASGQTAEAFASKHRLAVSTLRWWSSELHGERRASVTDRVEVREVLVAGSGDRESTFELGIGSVVLRFEVGTDPSYVAAIVAALSVGPTA